METVAERAGNLSKEFECLRCGRCCLSAGPVLHVEQVDVERWKKQGRSDILSKLFLDQLGCEECGIEWPPWHGNKCWKCGREGKPAVYYWIDERQPMTVFAQLLADPICPFLQKVRKKDEYLCKINDTKPEICREFPELKPDEVTKNEEECIEWGCRGYLKWKQKFRQQKKDVGSDFVSSKPP